MSSNPPLTITSASPIFWQFMPTAPASSCALAKWSVLWVLMCGRNFKPRASQWAWNLVTFPSATVSSITNVGVSMLFSVQAMRMLRQRPNCARQVLVTVRDGIVGIGAVNRGV